jgi:hypothetical protein
VVGDVSENMALEGELLENQKHLVELAGVVVGLHVENGWDEGVLDTDGLGVEVDDGSGLVSQQGIPERLTRTTIANIAGKGGGVVLVLDGGLGNFSLAGSVSERARGGGIALLGRSCGLLLGDLGTLEGGVPGSGLLAAAFLGDTGVLSAVRAGTLGFGGAEALCFLSGFGIGGRGGGWSRPRHGGREGCAARRHTMCAAKGHAVESAEKT